MKTTKTCASVCKCIYSLCAHIYGLPSYNGMNGVRRTVLPSMKLSLYLARSTVASYTLVRISYRYNVVEALRSAANAI